MVLTVRNPVIDLIVLRYPVKVIICKISTRTAIVNCINTSNNTMFYCSIT